MRQKVTCFFVCTKGRIKKFLRIFVATHPCVRHSAPRQQHLLFIKMSFWAVPEGQNRGSDLVEESHSATNLCVIPRGSFDYLLCKFAFGDRSGWQLRKKPKQILMPCIPVNIRLTFGGVYDKMHSDYGKVLLCYIFRGQRNQYPEYFRFRIFRLLNEYLYKIALTERSNSGLLAPGPEGWRGLAVIERFGGCCHGCMWVVRGKNKKQNQNCNKGFPRHWKTKFEIFKEYLKYESCNSG